LPPYSPDLNPIEIDRAFTRTSGVHALISATLKAVLRKAAARTYDDLWKAVGAVCDLFIEDECLNYFIAAGYKPESPQHTLIARHRAKPQSTST
jgi:transposase